MIEVLELINKSEKQIDEMEIDFSKIIGFGRGGAWMANRMNIENLTTFDKYRNIGLLKYGLSCLSIVISWFIIKEISILYLLIIIVIFYLIEVHFLFVFPLLIDNKKPVVLNSVKLVYKYGFLRCLMNTMIIAAYMIAGVTNFRKPFYNWYVGCNSVIIWYEEVRSRL